MKNKFFAGLLAALMLLSAFQSVLLGVSAAGADTTAESGETVLLGCKSDFLAFAKACTLDTWSQSKTVKLTCDLDFSDGGFIPVPIFGGVFDGGGHTISGITIAGDGSYLGVFRRISAGGRISNLNVRATVLPGGSKSAVGGIAGENAGTVESCGFDGVVKGEKSVGGIVGCNLAEGRVIFCTASGSVSGENATGGIVGKNEGLILKCTNSAEVNTVYEEKQSNIADLSADMDAVVESYTGSQSESENESILGHSDTGGIAGYSSGIVGGCTNNAAIGYPHVGYNVGGIAGRQSGYLYGCQNLGLIQGRKDVGGIVGQAEPYILLDVSEDALEKMQRELDKLHGMVNDFIDDTDALGDDVGKNLTSISDSTAAARDSAENLVNLGTDFVDDNLHEINRITALVSDTLDRLSPVFDRLESGGGKISEALDQISSALGAVEVYAPDLTEEADRLSTALNKIAKGMRSIKKATAKANEAADDLEHAVIIKDETEIKKAGAALLEAVQSIIAEKQAIRDALDEIQTILESKPESFEDIGADAETLIACLGSVTSAVDATVSALQTIKASLDTLFGNTEIDFAKFKSAAQNAEAAAEYLGKGMGRIASGVEEIAAVIESASDKLKDYTDDISRQLNTALDDLSTAMQTLSDAVDDITAAIGETEQIVADLAAEEPLTFVTLGDDFRAESDALFDALADISAGLDDLKQTASGGQDDISGHLTAIGNQFNTVMNVLIDGFEELRSGSSLSDVFLDVSDEDIEKTTQGKIANCRNFGGIEADRCTGGIVGAMAIEYAKDPEDDLEKPDSLNFSYRTKAILEACVNEGKIGGKKDCVGGIVGLSELGTVYLCENYGDAESTGGSYVGGVAGKSESSVRKCFAKSTLTGKCYVGGIAGKGDILTSCYASVRIVGDEYTGAVCGDAEALTNLLQNFFVNAGLGAVDGISYSGRAEPVAFADLSAAETPDFNELGAAVTVPDKFVRFTVTFVADGQTVAVEDAQYGDPVSALRYPEIPSKAGQFGKWQTIEAETITENLSVECEYQPYVTILASAEKDASGKLALALAAGEFTDDAVLHITSGSVAPPERKGGVSKVYDLSLTGTDLGDGDSVTFRLLNDGRGRATAWQYMDGEWKALSLTERGKYLLVEVTGTDSTICLHYALGGASPLWWLLLLLIPAVAIPLVVRAKRKKNSKAKQQ